MTFVTANMSMSLDGFVSHPTDGVTMLFKWYSAGDVTTSTTQPERWEFYTTAEEAAKLAEAKKEVGALVYGRRTFEEAGGWGGTHPLGAPVVVLSHSVPEGWPKGSVHFVTEGGVAAAIARAAELAGDKAVVLGSASTTSQALNAGLLDELTVDLIPAMLGEGVRFFDGLEGTPYELEQIGVSAGPSATHLTYRVLKK
jgi:dihydrofolate reductase